MNALIFLKLQKMFSVSDAYGVYWKNEVHKSDRGKTAFTSSHGLRQYERNIIEFWNARSTIQQQIDVILSTVKSLYAVAYLTETFIFKDTRRAYRAHINGLAPT